MLEINLNLCLGLLLLFNYFRNGAAVNYNPYENKQQHHLLHTTNTAQQSAFYMPPNTVYPTNLQGNSNYQQLYRYYYIPPYQQQQQQQVQQQQPQQSAQLWSGPPIVVDDDDIQQRQSSADIIPPTTFYQPHSTAGIKSNSESLPFLPRQSKVLTPTVYNQQPTTAHTVPAYVASNNNNNNNIIYHRDFRPEIYARPASEHTRQEDNTISWSSRQHQQLYSSDDKNLSYNNRISNDLHAAAAALRKVDGTDYGEHFKRYLENNPYRIKPIY